MFMLNFRKREKKGEDNLKIFFFPPLVFVLFFFDPPFFSVPADNQAVIIICWFANVGPMTRATVVV